MRMKILGTSAGYAIKTFVFKIIVSCTYRDNGFGILVIYSINIAMGGYETEVMIRHNTNNTLFVQIWRTYRRVVYTIISTDLFCFISTRFKEIVKHGF